MLSILAFLTGMGPLFNSISEGIFSLQKAKINATTEQARIEINKEIEALHDKRAVLVAEAGSRLNAITRAFIAVGPALYLNKIFLWDKVIGSLSGCAGVNSDFCRTMFQTDPLDPYLWGVATAVIGFYFLSSTLRK